MQLIPIHKSRETKLKFSSASLSQGVKKKEAAHRANPIVWLTFAFEVAKGSGKKLATGGRKRP